jgi:hypothetical protein
MSYEIAYDTTLAPPRAAAIVSFMEDFYRTSDTESLHEKYVASFTDDATLIMGSKEAKGKSGMCLQYLGLVAQFQPHRPVPADIHPYPPTNSGQS